MIVKFISRRRWLKKIFKNFLPDECSHKLYGKHEFYYDPRDLRGPSFHFAYDLEEGFENYEKESKLELLEHIPQEGVFYDIGANIGLFSYFIALKRPKAKFFCFEPEPVVFNCLKKSFSHLDASQVKIFNSAVGTVEESRKLFKSDINDGGHTLVKELIGDEERADQRVVEVINLDQRFQKGELPAPDAIKIDVEGFELEVLKGISTMVRTARPSLLIECSNGDLADKGAFFELLKTFEGIKAKIPGKEGFLNLEELSAYAKSRANVPLENYLFVF